MLVISIQSQVVFGHVGNTAAVYPMQAEGVTVAAVPTTLLSNHPRYPTTRGRVLDADLVADLLLGVEERGLVEQAAVVVTGCWVRRRSLPWLPIFVERALKCVSAWGLNHDRRGGLIIPIQ
jgi:pyridoxine kinase